MAEIIQFSEEITICAFCKGKFPISSKKILMFSQPHKISICHNCVEKCNKLLKENENPTTSI